jgi:hypothetical protein
MPDTSPARGPLDPCWFVAEPPPALPPQQQQHQHHIPSHLQQQHQVHAEPSAAGKAVFAKNELLWYCDRSGIWLPAKVMHVDLSLQPPAYQIQMEGDGGIKDTEGSLLKPRTPGEAPPAPGTSSSAALYVALCKNLLAWPVRGAGGEEG